MEAPAVGTEVPIAKFPEPETPIDFEDLPFWDPVPEHIYPVNVPVDVNNLYLMEIPQSSYLSLMQRLLRMESTSSKVVLTNKGL